MNGGHVEGAATSGLDNRRVGIFLEVAGRLLAK